MVRSSRLFCLALLLSIGFTVIGCSDASSGAGRSGGAASGDARSGDGGDTAARIGELERRLEPALPAMMTGITARHATLWFAATYGNWAFARYQLDGLEAALEDVRTIHPERAGVEIARLLDQGTVPALQAVGDAIQAQSVEAFEAAFDGLTRACNDCHAAADLEAVRVQRPSLPPFTNLRYEP